MTIVKTDDLGAPRETPAPKRSTVLVTDPNGKAITKTAHPLISVDNLDLSPGATAERRAKNIAAMDANLERLAKKCEKSGVTVYPRRKK